MQAMRGIGLMMLAMALLALSDMFIKSASFAGFPPGQVIVSCSSIGGTAFFILIAAPPGRAHLDPRRAAPGGHLAQFLRDHRRHRLMLGLAWVPLSQFAAIMQMAPLIVVIGAATRAEGTGRPAPWLAVAAGIVGCCWSSGRGWTGSPPPPSSR